MKTKDVSITIKGLPVYENQAEGMEFLTMGTLSVGEKEGHYDLAYQESELTGMEGTTTTFKITPKRILLMRMGSVNNQMLFEKGRKHNAIYATPFGNMQVGVCASHVFSSVTESGGELEIDYSIEIDHALVGANSLRISVKDMSSTHSAHKD
jgi:uncharacterized beta-barrel protein YwiB (DUF1934 family)